ncbi:uncharacterized protein LOC113851226 [Abrus precatorius]|uniref:Uncharacterized protein LOC113851226 n=1 Tax=Abrus precatorius TaxID=3816 RepID=A0A8B8K266_ABRPR|nr:uncharacterized protein LOC113851226 [Abrus precatorius]
MGNNNNVDSQSLSFWICGVASVRNAQSLSSGKMANIAVDLVKSILERLINCAIAESRYVCCFSDIVEDIEKEKKALEENVKEEKRKGNNIRTDVSSWLKETEGLIKDTQTKKTCFFGWCPDCKWRYSKGKQLANKKKELKSGNVGISPVLPGVEYHSSQDYVSFESRKSKIEELFDALKNDSNFIIGLQGMGGTGKTTLAKEVGKELKQLQQFDHVIDTTVSYTPDTRKIQDDIAAPLGLDFKDKNESERLKLLWNRLTGGEKILLILDDAWNPINFDEIGIPRKDNHNGCRIFLTTREMKVCQTMGCEKIIQLGVLTGEDAWTLFKKHAHISDRSSKRLLDKGRDITEKCGGLPVAIAAIASSLKGEESVEVWKSTLKSLQKSVPMHGVDESLVEVYKCLRDSYDNLKNEEAKKLFLLCSMFPEDEELSNETLTTFGIGAGLLGEVDGKYDEARDQVVVAMNKFVDSCLLLKGGKQSVKMHDLVREVALWIANEEIQAVNLSSKNQKLLLERRKNIKYLLCEGKGMDVFSCKFNRSKLVILKVVYMHEDEDENAFVEVPNSFFENMTELRVLHLSLNTWRDVYLSLPQSFPSLTNIRSLILERLSLEDFSVLKNIQNLETLDLVWCRMYELPGEIAKLEKLRVLRLRECIVEDFNSIKVIEKCSLLEELYIVSTDLTFDTSAMHEKINFPAFQRYIMSDDRTAVDESLSKCVAFPKIDAIFSEVTFNHLVQTSELLHLQKIEGEWRNLIPDIVPIYRGSSCKNDSMEKIESNIKKCNISPWIHMCYPHKCRRKVKSTKSTALPFVSGEPLQDSSNSLVSNFDYLHLWQRAQCLSKQPQIMRNIKNMNLQNFSKIKSVFILSIAPMMLETLRIEDCDELQHIIVDITDGDNNLSYVFPKLKKIIVKSCRQLEYLFGSCDDHQNHKINVDLPVLESLCLRDLPCLIGICSKNYSTTLPPLMKFVLNGCSQISIKSIGDFILSLSNTSIKELSETKHLLSLENLWVDGSKIENICCFNEIIGQEIILGWENIRLEDLPHMTYLFVGPRNSFILQNLMELTIAQCEKLEVIFTASISRCLPQLERLLIKECKELKQIIEENAENQEMSFPKLGEIVVEKCNKLTYLFPFSTSKELLQLRLLIIKEASELKEVFRCEADQKVQFPRLRLLVFVKLPIFSFSQGIQLEYTDLWVQSCPNLSLTSTIESDQLKHTVHGYAYGEGYYSWEILRNIVQDLKHSIIQDPSNEWQTTKITEDIQGELEVQATSQSELASSEVNTNQSIAEIKHETVEEDSSLKIPSSTTSPIKWHEAHSDVLLDEQSTGEPCLMNQNQAIGLTDTTFKISQGNNCLKEIEDQSNQEDSLSKQTITTTLFMDSEKRNTSPRQLLPPIQEGVERNFEVGTTSANVVIVASPNYGRTFFNETPMEEHSSMKEQQPLGKTDIGFECLEDRENQSTQEGSILGKNTTATLLMKSEIRNTSLGPLLSPLEKGIKRNVEEGNTSANFKSITSLTRSELGPSVASKGETYPREHGDGQMAIPYVLAVPPSAQDTSEIALALTNSHDPGFSRAEGPAILEGISCTTAEKVIACPTLEEITAAVCVEGSTKPATTQPIVEETGLVPPEVTSESTFLGLDEIKKLIEEDPLSALENLLIGKVSISQMQSSSIGILLQDLKALLMDSNLDHLVTHEESRSKLVSLLEQLNQHQRLLSSEAKDFVKNVENFCDDYFGKHTTSQQVINKHKQLLQSKEDLLNKLSSAKSTQSRIDNKSCTAKVQIDELSLKIDDLRKQVADTEHQIDALKLTMKMCDLEKEKLKAECTQWAQQSAQLLSALSSSEIDVQEVQHANNMAKEAFANLKSSFPTF